MATPLSEVITYLSFDSTIAVGDSYETIKVLLQEFGSLSVTVVSDENLSFRISFSNDGTNFDYVSNNSIQGGVPLTITSVILGKWCKMTAIHSGINVANVRFTTYCQVIPIAQQSQLEKQGNVFPSVNVDNFQGTLFNDLRVAERRPIYDHKFDYTTVVSNTIVSPDRLLVQKSGGGIVPALSRPYASNNVLSLSDIYYSPAGSYLSVEGPPVVYIAGNPIYVTFSAGFKTAGYTNADIFGFDNMLIGMGFIDGSGNVVDGIYIGYPSAPQPPDTIISEISLIYYGNSIERYIPISRWSFDTLDGNGPSGIVLDSTKLSTWRIRAAQISSIYLEYHNPTDNVWIPCHRIQIENLFTVPGYLSPSFGFSMITKRTSTATGVVGNDLIGPYSSQGVIGVETGATPISRVQTYNIESAIFGISAGVETEILSIRAGELLNGKNNRGIIFPTSISFSSDGTRLCKFKIYREGTFNTPTWTYQDPVYTAIQFLSGGNAIVGTGYNAASFFTGRDRVETTSLREYNLSLAQEQTITITATPIQNGTGIQCLFNYNMID